MNLCVFLAIGENWEDFEAKGQDKLLIKNNFKYYGNNFDQVYIFSYGVVVKHLLPNVELLPNRWRIHRFIYAFIVPFIYRELINNCSLIRCYQLTGAIPGLVSKLLFQKRIIVNYGYDYAQIARIEKKPFRSMVFRLLEKIILPFVDRVIVTTKELRKRISGKSEDQIVVIPNGVDTVQFAPAKQKKSYGGVFVGRLEPQKNLQLLIKAWSLLPGCFRKENLLFIGNGIEEKIIKELATKLAVNLKIISAVPHDKLNNYLQKSKIFILPSLVEGHPKALLEAMSSGLPVIGTNVSGIREIIHSGKNGLLVNSNPQDLSRSLAQLFSRPKLRRSLGITARKYVIKNFSASKIWAREIALMNELIT